MCIRDRVLVDLKLFIRDEIKSVVGLVNNLFNVLISQSERYKHILMPGYTHLQIAMPSSFGLWFGAYAESLTDDLTVLQAAYRVSNRNPLGSAAGYGSSFPLNLSLIHISIHLIIGQIYQLGTPQPYTI